MNRLFITKLRIVYLPYVFLSIGLILAYTFLNWLLFINLQLFQITEESRNLWIPLILAILVLFIWYRPIVKLLRFKDKNRDPATGITLLAAFSVIAPMLITQAWLSTASGKLSNLNSVSEIGHAKQTRYYRFKDYEIDNQRNWDYSLRTVSGKNNQYLDFSLYIVCAIYDKGQTPKRDIPQYPIPDSGPLYMINGKPSDEITFHKIPQEDIASIQVLKGPSAIALYGPAGNQGVLLISTKKTVKIIDQQALKDTLHSLPDSVTDQMTDTEVTKIGTIALDSVVYPWAWIGVKYQKQISNRLDTASKRMAFEQFKKESWDDYSSRPTKGFTYFDNIPYSQDYKVFEDAAKGADCYLYSRKFILLEPNTEPFENRNGQKLPWIFGAFAIGAAIYLFILSFIPLDQDKLAKKEAGHSTETIKKDWKATIDFLKPKPEFYATPIIIYVNLAVFLLMVFAGLGFFNFEAKDLVQWGANYGPYTTKGQWWRLLTSTFVHAGLMHLLLNMYALLFVGLFLEPVLGKNRFVICYFVTGLIASLTSLKIHPQVVSIGASGAIFGMYGIFLAFLISKIFPATMQKAFLTSTLIFVGYNLIIGISGGVDNAAHIGGLISGFVIGWLLAKTIKMEKEES